LIYDAATVSLKEPPHLRAYLDVIGDDPSLSHDMTRRSSGFAPSCLGGIAKIPREWTGKIEQRRLSEELFA
jgi:hypothetical protein